MVNKRRGYYEIEVDGVKIIGHFSVNFWVMLEEQMGLKGLEETLLFYHKE